MESLLRRFDAPLQLSITVAVVALLAAVVVAWREHAAGRDWQRPSLRLLAAGAVGVVLAATAWSPGQWSWGHHDVALGIGDGGLGDWRRLIAGRGSVVGWQFLLNVALYVPVGLLVPLGWRRTVPLVSAAQGVLLAGALSVGVELFQYQFADRITATDDVILNTVGGLLGALVAWVALRRRRHAPVAATATRTRPRELVSR